MTKSFDSLYESIINEMMPVTSEFGSFAGGLKSGIESAPGGGYLIGAIATALGISKQEAVDKISAGLYDKLFGANGINPANNEDAYRAAITKALEEIVKDLKTQHPEAKIPTAAAIRGYTARVISSLGTATKDFGTQATTAAVKTAVEDASEEEVSTDDTEDKKETSAPKAASFRASGEYYLKPREEIPAGTLSGDLETAYSRLEGYSGETNSGTDLEKFLRKSGIEQGKISSYLRKFVELGVLEPSEETAAASADALEAGEDRPGFARREFERDPNMMAAYKDYMASGGGKSYGVDFG